MPKLKQEINDIESEAMNFAFLKTTSQRIYKKSASKNCDYKILRDATNLRSMLPNWLDEYLVEVGMKEAPHELIFQRMRYKHQENLCLSEYQEQCKKTHLFYAGVYKDFATSALKMGLFAVSYAMWRHCMLERKIAEMYRYTKATKTTSES